MHISEYVTNTWPYHWKNVLTLLLISILFPFLNFALRLSVYTTLRAKRATGCLNKFRKTKYLQVTKCEKKFVHFSLTIFSHTKINFRIWDFLEKKLWQFSVKIQMELFRPFLKLCGFVLFSNSRCMTKSMLGDHNPLKSWNNTQDAVHPWSAQHFQVSKYSKFFDLLALLLL